MITIDFSCLAVPMPCRVLDIGCGSGRHLTAAGSLDGALIIGADPKIPDLNLARERLQLHRQFSAAGCDSRCHLTAASLDNLPFKDHRFDLVICSEVLEHLPDVHQAIGELIRVLAPDGQLVVSVPRRWPEALCWLLSRRYRHTPGGHLRIFSASRLTASFQRRGMHHWRTHWAHSLHAPYWWLKCIVGIERDDFPLVRLYHQLLVWDMMKHPPVMRFLDRWFNPLFGKSVVLYFSKRVPGSDGGNNSLPQAAGGR